VDHGCPFSEEHLHTKRFLNDGKSSLNNSESITDSYEPMGYKASLKSLKVLPTYQLNFLKPQVKQALNL